MHKLIFNIGKLNQKKHTIKTICIGNVTAGGSGKTPIVLELIKNIKHSIVVSRGYTGSFSGEITDELPASYVGDEPKMLSNYTTVFVGKNRNKSISQIEKKYPNTTAIILDDAFQNAKTYYNLKILVFDGNIGIGNGLILPAGPLRETLKSGVKQADCIIIIGTDKHNLQKKISKIKNIPIFFASSELTISKNIDSAIAFAGIGYPEKFFNSLKNTNIQSITTIPFPDHHKYSENDLLNLEKMAQLQHSCLITTEKDWIKFPKSWQNKITVAHLKTTIEPDFYKWLSKEIAND